MRDFFSFLLDLFSPDLFATGTGGGKGPSRPGGGQTRPDGPILD